MKKLVKKPVFKKNQMIITALAGMIAIAGYLNYAGTDVNPSLLSVDSEAVEDVAETDLAQDISAEDTYALTGEVDEGSQDIASLDENEDGDVAVEEGTDAGADRDGQYHCGCRTGIRGKGDPGTEPLQK